MKRSGTSTRQSRTDAKYAKQIEAVILAALLCLTPLSARQGISSAQAQIVDFTHVIENAPKAVVTIYATDSTGKKLVQGSGFLITSTGVVVTNFHVGGNSKNLLARMHNGAFLVVERVLEVDKDDDLMLLKVDGRELPFLTLGDSDQVKLGQPVVAIGSPFGLEGTVSTGIISAIRERETGGQWLQTTAPISKGSSGGPLLNHIRTGRGCHHPHSHAGTEPQLRRSYQRG